MSENDIGFRSPRFDRCGNKISNARITVLHNGVAVHDNFEVLRKTGAGKQESPEAFPIKLQNHKNPIVFRNIWLIDHSAASCQPCQSLARQDDPFRRPAQLLAVSN